MPLTRRQFAAAALVAGLAAPRLVQAAAPKRTFPYTLTPAQWRARLVPAAYAVLREASTERAYTSPLNAEKRAGTFACAGCALPLYASRAKYDSGTGWPSFWAALPQAVGTSTDYDIGLPRTEVHCARCGGHLGHIFDDGPRPTGKRHCINGVALAFTPAKA